MLLGNFFVAALTGSSLWAVGFEFFAAGVAFAFAALGSSLGATAFALACTLTAFALAAFAALTGSSLGATALVASGSFSAVTVVTVASLLHNLQLVSRNFLSRALGALSLESEHYSLNCKEEAYDSSPSASSLLEAWQPSCVVGTERLESTPEAVSHVEPESGKAHEIHYESDGASKSLVEIPSAFVYMVSQHFRELHLSPELNEVESHKAHDDNTEDEHVLRSPFHVFRTCAHFITVVSARFLVLP